MSEEFDWEEIADYGEEKLSWLKTFLKLPNGIPSHDTFRRVFMLLDPKEFNRCFLEWTQSIRSHFKGEVIALDGNGSLRRRWMAATRRL